MSNDMTHSVSCSSLLKCHWHLTLKPCFLAACYNQSTALALQAMHFSYCACWLISVEISYKGILVKVLTVKSCPNWKKKQRHLSNWGFVKGEWIAVNFTAKLYRKHNLSFLLLRLVLLSFTFSFTSLFFLLLSPPSVSKGLLYDH